MKRSRRRSTRSTGPERIPLQLGFHFTLMNDGAYWKALERFAEEVCVKADVVCTSYGDYLEADAARRYQGCGQDCRRLRRISALFGQRRLLALPRRPFEVVLVDLGQWLAFQRRLERAQALVDRR